MADGSSDSSSHEYKVFDRFRSTDKIFARKRESPSTTMDSNADKTVWHTYNERADIVDRELIKDWNDSLNTLLIFTPAFEHEEFTPKDWAVRVNYCFFTSISCSLVAALGAVLALQWAGSYSLDRIRAPATLRATQRQLRYNGIRKWKLTRFISLLPLLIYISLFLFFVGLSEWLQHIHRHIAGVVLTGVVIAGLLYITTHAISILDVSAPFRTPISRYLPYLIQRAHWWIFPATSSLNKQEEDRKPEERRWSSQVLDEVSGLQRLVKIQVTRLRTVWFNLRSSLYTIQRIIMNPEKPMSFKYRELRALESDPILQRDGILWVAKQTHVLPSSRLLFVTLLKEVALVQNVHLIDSGMSSALWPPIFQNVLQRFYDMQSITPGAFSDQIIAELEIILTAVAWVGTVPTRNFTRLCDQLSCDGFGMLSTFAKLLQWKFYSGTLSHILDQSPHLILELADPWIYTILHRFYSHGRPNDGSDLIRFLDPLTISEHYEGEPRLLDPPKIFVLMKIVICIQGYNTYHNDLWEQYRQAVSNISDTRSDYNTLQTCHTVILLQLLCHISDLQNRHDEVLYAVIQYCKSHLSSDNLRPLILRLSTSIRNSVGEGQQMSQLVPAVCAIICGPDSPSSESPSNLWAEILKRCNQILSHERDSRFSVNLLVSSLLRAAKASGCPLDSHRSDIQVPIEHPAILILASLILPDRYLLNPLKEMSLAPEIRQDPSFADLLEFWSLRYRSPPKPDTEAECIVVLELADVLDAVIAANYIARQRFPVKDTSTFPDCFFEADGITWLATRLRAPNYETERDDMVELIIHCIKESTSVTAFRNSLHLVSTYIEVTGPVEAAHRSYSLFEEILTKILTFRAPCQNHSRLRCSPFRDSLIRNGLEDQLKGEVETIIETCKRNYLLSPPADGDYNL
ncbi:hypothetical protein PIIN_05684 [Serendipita indica DSM 11827]|uniref:DUF6535 domain-containing protein n=1 Tax=Serendipita indica (strain DSM 11827) TaxID=1109443 RepID=G4TK97_SERID|nr:hypothetical protein PIIN_05684 [Serendipita indica DSM 11827]